MSRGCELATPWRRIRWRIVAAVTLVSGLIAAGCPLPPEPEMFEIRLLIGADMGIAPVVSLEVSVVGSGGGSSTETYPPPVGSVFGFPWMAPNISFEGIPGNGNISVAGRDINGLVVAAGNEPIELYEPVVTARVSLAVVTQGTCGDGIVGGLEQCDDANLLDGDGCSATCVLEGICSNGVLDPGEECDREDLDGATCASLGLGTGTLGCAPDCTYDSGDCTP